MDNTPSPEQEPHQHHNAAAPEAPEKISDTPPSVEAPKTKARDNAPSVRFSSAVEEISPDAPPPAAVSADASAEPDNSFNEVTADQIRAFTKSLRGLPLQERRMSTFGGFEAFSLPPSRVPSREDVSAESTRIPTPNSSGWQSPHGSPRLSALTSPPLTPAGSDPSRSNKDIGAPGVIAHDPHIITPHPSSSHEKSPTTAERKHLVYRPASSDQAMHRSSSADEQVGDARSHRKGLFGVGPGSVPVSRESSPTRSSASHYYSKPMTPIGDVNDPYAKGRRPPQQQHPTRHSVDARFVFSRKKKHSSSPSSSKSSLGLYPSHKNGGDESGSNEGIHAHGHASQGSMSDLKRFFRKPGHHKKRESSPAPSMKTTLCKSSHSNRSTQQLPFSDDHGLTSKYGKLGKVLGSGAGGSVRLMRRKEDGTVFAVKEFRARHTYETEKEYNKKVTAEFCVGSTLHHGNVIETLDILQEKGRWFEVMEYAPFDLFAIVMTGKMSREEVRCSFLQILNGVTYLHSMGLAHRDLKLDNVVVSDKGIMKIIDFGSAHVFKYPFESGSVPAKGIVGSDPYLAPEVYDSKEYDAEAVDIWSLAIIFCCMTLRRFPWKIPRMTDNSYKLFAAEPTPGHDPSNLVRPKSTNDLSSAQPREFLTEDDLKDKGHNHRHHHHHHGHKRQDSDATTLVPETQSQTQGTNGEKKEVIRGPWRILRLLPRDSRHIIHRMLDVNPKTRAGMEEILEEPWVADTVICQQLENGEVIPAEDHEHVLEPPSSQQQQQQQQQQGQGQGQGQKS